MLWKKIAKFYASYQKQVLLILFVTFFLLTRIPRLYNDTINPDGVNWHYRSQQFINGLKYGQFEKTYQHYHPGVTLMWITGIPVEITKHIIGQKDYTHLNFQTFDFVAKLSDVLVQLGLSVLAIFLLSKVLSFVQSTLVISLFTFEPFFVGNSRLYHMDVLLALFILNALLFAYLYVINKKLIFGALTGLFLAFSFLTKSIGIGVFVYVFFTLIILQFVKGKFHARPQNLLIVAASFVFFTFLFFPALWVRPVFYLNEIFSESERVGVRGGHTQIIMGEETESAGPAFYLLVLAMKVSPLIWLGMLLNLSRIKNIKKDFNLKDTAFTVFLFLAVFCLGYILVMTFPTKKLDRYLIPVYPFLAYTAFWGFEYFFRHFKKYLAVLFLMAVVFIVLPLISFYPYYFTYTSPLFGSPENANKLLAQKPFGVGVYDLKTFILSKYGEKKLGFIDIKPIESIYPASKVFNIRIDGTKNYDLLVLAINEDFSEKVKEADINFEKDSSIFINGLEFWRIYVKKPL